MKEIKIKYHTDIDRLEQFDNGDFIDLRAAEDVFIEEGTSKLISLGISVKLPEGYEAHVLPRSSTFKNFGIILTNSMGIIDNSYSGNDDIWMMNYFCLEGKCVDAKTGKKGTYIDKNTRIGQFRIIKSQEKINFIEVKELEGKNRGGFGSTGNM